jgi:hypothetical protein
MRWVLALFVLGGTAMAGPRDEDKAEADRLFYEGRQLLAKDKRVEACQKFDLSFRKDPRAIGTLLNLGLCNEMSGQVATAVRLYQEARDRAHDQSLAEYQDAAQRKIALLAPRVPHVKITLAEPLPDMHVLVDNIVLALDQLGDVTLDPGSRTIVVTARGHLPYETKIDVVEGKPLTVEIPRLAGQTVIVRENSRRTWGKVTLASGAGVLAAGIGLGLYARSAYWSEFPDGAKDGAIMDANHNCWTELVGTKIERQCNEIGQDHLASARRLSHISTAMGIVGALAIGAGAYLWWTAPKDEPLPALGVAIDDHGLTGVTLSGRF